MDKSVEILKNSPINRKRVKAGFKPASSIWLWGQGLKPDIPTYQEKYNISGSVITAVDLIKGIGIYAGLDIINVPGVTGYLDTNYKGKAEYALKSLKVKDFVFVHVESPDETGHNGDIKGKIRAIEDFDNLVVGTILKGIHSFSNYRILVTADHPTPISIKTHARGYVPFAIYGTGIKKDSVKSFSESSISRSKIRIKKGYTLLPWFLKEELKTEKSWLVC
jgi:2,3-bisphosphoglycerate-independent phosphoglycerate mutase